MGQAIPEVIERGELAGAVALFVIGVLLIVFAPAKTTEQRSAAATA